MNASFWNERYSDTDFAYGKEPNTFLASISFQKNSKILCLAEGEGRNGVHLACQGHSVTCVDFSEEGLRKTQRLASLKNVKVETICADLDEFELGTEKWDAVVIIFGHFPEKLREKVHTKIFNSLKKGGLLVLEAYSKQQLNYDSGGPKQLEMLYDSATLKQDFCDFDSLKMEEKERNVEEGKFHNGKAAVIQVVGKKK